MLLTPKTQRRIAISLCIGWLFLAAGPAFADFSLDEYIQSLYEGRFIDRYDASSVCIGDMRAPLCAVETYIACQLRGDEKACHAGLPERIETCDEEDMHMDGCRNPKAVTDPDEIARILSRPPQGAEHDPILILDTVAVEFRASEEQFHRDWLTMPGPLGAPRYRLELEMRYHARDGTVWPLRGWQKVEYELERQHNGYRVSAIRRGLELAVDQPGRGHEPVYRFSARPVMRDRNGACLPYPQERPFVRRIRVSFPG